ncbi:Uncharacterised protein [Mycobacteroides abscessus subsp. abscessus]|nr:Uncharacterised protein [Mycobacteroides abscessus subsp. abscessus]
MVEESLERRQPGRTSDDPTVQADRQHLRCTLESLAIEHVECVTQLCVELFTRGKAAGRREPHVVGVHRVGHDEMVDVLDRPVGAPRHLDPVRQIVGVTVGVVGESPVLDDQIASLRRVSAGVPTERSRPGDLGQQLDRRTHVLALDVLVDHLIVQPAISVTRDFVAALDECRRNLGIARHRLRDGEDRQRQFASRERTQDAPHPRTGAVLVERLHAHVPIRK